MPSRSPKLHASSAPGPESPVALGFTLVEMLIALVITGIMAGGVITLLMGQNKFYGSTDDAVYAEQSLRATSDLLASELRMIHPANTQGDVVTAQSDQLTFRLDTHRGAVCEVASGDVYVFMFSEPSAPNVKSTGKGYAVKEAYSGSAWTYDSWDPMSGTVETAASKTSTIATTCESGGGPTPTTNNYGQFMVFRDWGGTPVPDDGAVLRIYGEVTYQFGPSNFGSGTAIFRNGQELAAPFQSGASFAYVTSSGVQSSVGSSNHGSIQRIRLSATAVGSGQNRYGVTRDLQFDIPLRN